MSTVTPPHGLFSSQQQAEAAYQGEVARTRYILDNALTGINTLRSVRDEAGTITDFEYTYVNAVSAQMAGKTPEQMLGHRLTVLFPGVIPNGLFARWVGLVETGEPLHWQEHYTEDGIDRWYETRAVRDGDGLLQSYIDITAQKQAQQETHRQTDLLKSILDTSLTAIVQFETVRTDAGAILDFRLMMVNQPGTTIYGMRADELVGKTALELNPALAGSEALGSNYLLCRATRYNCCNCSRICSPTPSSLPGPASGPRFG